MKYNFDKIIDRRMTNSMSVEGYEGYLFEEQDDLNLKYPEDQLIRMWVADMEFATAPEIIEKLKERVARGIFGYSKIIGWDYVLAFLKWTHSRYGWEFDKTHLVTSHGVVPALYDLIGYVCKPNDKVLILTPSYAYFKHAADFNDTELVTSDLIYEEGDYRMDFEDIQTKTSDPNLKLCILCSPHNPTGRIWTELELRTFGEICLKNGVLVIADEIHCDLLRKGKEFIPLAKLFPETDQIITCMSPSKTFNLAGFMFANIIIPNEALRNHWLDKHLSMDNPLSILAAQTAYEEGAAWLNELTDYLDKNFEYTRDYLQQHLPKAEFVISEATYLSWINLSAYFSKDENLTLFFANNAGVLLEGGNLFVSNSDGFIRLNLACPLANLKEGLKRICQAVDQKTV